MLKTNRLTDESPVKKWSFFKTPSVLIVDDSRLEATIITSLLKNKGVNVNWVDKGKKALEVIDELKPDLVLLDVVMPDMDGFELCKKLSRQPSTRKIPVIFTTSLDKPQYVLKGFSVGGADYVPKPFRTEELMARVKIHLESSMLRQERLHRTNMLIRSEQQLQRVTLAEGLAHNLNNLLSPLMGNLHWLRDMLNNPEAEGVVEEMLEVVKRLERLSAALTGRSQTDLLTTMPLGALLTETSHRFQLNIDPNISFIADFDEDEPHEVSQQLETAVSAVLTNAKEAIEDEGEIILQVEKDPERNRIFITVTDTGKGLDEATQSKAFLPFFSTKESVGTGLGLHTAQLLVERMGGAISLGSRKDGPGAEASIQLPLDREAARPTLRIPINTGLLG